MRKVIPIGLLLQTLALCASAQAGSTTKILPNPQGPVVNYTSASHNSDSLSAVQKARHITEEMTSELNLSQDQMGKVMQINTTYEVQLTKAKPSIKAENGNVAGSAGDSYANINAARISGLTNVLTPEQMEKFRKVNSSAH